MRKTWWITHTLWKLAITIILVKAAAGLILGAKAPAILHHLPGYGTLALAMTMTIVALLADLIEDQRTGAPRRIFGTLSLVWLGFFWLLGPVLIRNFGMRSLGNLFSSMAYLVYAGSVVPVLAVLGLLFDKDGRRAGTALLITVIVMGWSYAKPYLLHR